MVVEQARGILLQPGYGQPTLLFSGSGYADAFGRFGIFTASLTAGLGRIYFGPRFFFNLPRPIAYRMLPSDIPSPLAME